MARTMGRGCSQASDRVSAQVSGRCSFQASGRGSFQVSGRGFGGGSSQLSRLAGERVVGSGCSQSSQLAGERVAGSGCSLSSRLAAERVSGRSTNQSSRLAGAGVARSGCSQASGVAGERVSVRSSSQSSRLAGEQSVRRSGSLVSSQRNGLAAGQEGDGDESIVHAMHSPMDSSDDDESTPRVAPARRGCASQVQVPEPINREWILIKNGEFSNQGTATRIIGSNLKALWSGPWDSWRDVSNEHRTRLFERFQSYFQWEKKWDAQIYSYWEKCIAGKFPNMLKTVRNKAKEEAIGKGLQVENDVSNLIYFKPNWIRSDTWKQMIDNWNKPRWIEKSKRNKRIRNSSIGGKHTLGAQTYATTKRKAAKILGREPSALEMWKQSHCRKGSRPLDIYLSDSSSLVSDIDSGENVQEENLVWVDDRAEDTWVKYNGYLWERYNGEPPKFDRDLWTQAAGGMKRGKVYGLGVDNDLHVHAKQDFEIEKLKEVIKDLVKEKEEDKEKFNGIISELKAQMENDKLEKNAMLVRMAKFESILAHSIRK